MKIVVLMIILVLPFGQTTLLGQSEVASENDVRVRETFDQIHGSRSKPKSGSEKPGFLPYLETLELMKVCQQIKQQLQPFSIQSMYAGKPPAPGETWEGKYRRAAETCIVLSQDADRQLMKLPRFKYQRKFLVSELARIGQRHWEGPVDDKSWKHACFELAKGVSLLLREVDALMKP